MEAIDNIKLTTALQQLINAELAHTYEIIPKKEDSTYIEFYCEEGKDTSIIVEELELILGKKITMFPVNAMLISVALVSYYRRGDDRSKEVPNETIGTPSNDFLEKLIFEAKTIGSSDIHFEVFKDGARVRFRIDGKLLERYTIEKENYLELVNKIKIKSNLDITEKRLPQDGRINYDSFDIRVSVLPTLHGEKIVMRILGRDTGHLHIDKLGMEETDKNAYLESLKASKGIILISGPTGSGKTTTLYASLKLLNKTSTNIVTVEDPIEYTLKGINQVQLREDIGLTFGSALRTFLRQDPDVIMLGEIRDAATAEMAIRASLTGHLVLSTIHTNSAVGTISRLIDMGIPPFLIAETLKISVAQRLVRKLCTKCKTEKPVDINQYPAVRSLQLDTHFTAEGCDACHYTGYKGRTALYEAIPIDHIISQEIKNNSSDLSAVYQQTGQESLGVKAMKLVKQGVTSIEEVYSILIDTQ